MTTITISTWRDALPDPWFHVCLNAAVRERELVENFDRLYGANLCRRGAPLDLTIDEATGRQSADMERFCEFVFDFVYARMEHPAGKWREKDKGTP
jgi:hypothetical protein